MDLSFICLSYKYWKTCGVCLVCELIFSHVSDYFQNLLGHFYPSLPGGWSVFLVVENWYMSLRVKVFSSFFCSTDHSVSQISKLTSIQFLWPMYSSVRSQMSEDCVQSRFWRRETVRQKWDQRFTQCARFSLVKGSEWLASVCQILFTENRALNVLFWSAEQSGL